MASFWRLAASKTTLPVLSIVAASMTQKKAKVDSTSLCDNSASTAPMADEAGSAAAYPKATPPSPDSKMPTFIEGMQHNAVGDYHGLFPLRQLFVPAAPYPEWNKNWDGRQPPSSGDVDKDKRAMRHTRKNGITRHIIMVRHGQYDETDKEDEKRILTPLGREQAHLTGKRIAEMMKGIGESTPCHVKAVRVSGLSRARETADIIATHLPGVGVEEPDPLINEGRPCHTIPGGPVSDKTVEMTDNHHPRIEEAFHKYFYRDDTLAALSDYSDSDSGEPGSTGDQDESVPKHEFEIIVCHANVIRYWTCRALQIPPEAWLRYCPFNCSLTYLTIRPTGTVSCRMLGDIGHLPYDASTFSGHHGYNW